MVIGGLSVANLTGNISRHYLFTKTGSIDKIYFLKCDVVEMRRQQRVSVFQENRENREQAYQTDIKIYGILEGRKECYFLENPVCGFLNFSEIATVSKRCVKTTLYIQGVSKILVLQISVVFILFPTMKVPFCLPKRLYINN